VGQEEVGAEQPSLAQQQRDHFRKRHADSLGMAKIRNDQFAPRRGAE
jgi:hypothetical protein